MVSPGQSSCALGGAGQRPSGGPGGAQGVGAQPARVLSGVGCGSPPCEAVVPIHCSGDCVQRCLCAQGSHSGVAGVADARWAHYDARARRAAPMFFFLVLCLAFGARRAPPSPLSSRPSLAVSIPPPAAPAPPRGDRCWLPSPPLSPSPSPPPPLPPPLPPSPLPPPGCEWGEMYADPGIGCATQWP